MMYDNLFFGYELRPETSKNSHVQTRCFVMLRQSVRIRVSDPSDLHFLPFFRSVFFYISFVFGIKPDVPVESPGCKLQFDTPFMGFHWFFVSHKMVGRKKLSKISNMPLFDLDQILIQCVPLPSVVISEVIWLATHL